MNVSKGRTRARVEADHKDGKGNLISRSISIQAPSPPSCMKLSCLWKFEKEVLLCALLSTYHRKRVEYAEKRRHKVIPMKIRTGEDSPSTLIGVIWGIVKFSLRR